MLSQTYPANCIRTGWGDSAAHYAARYGTICMLRFSESSTSSYQVRISTEINDSIIDFNKISQVSPWRRCSVGKRRIGQCCAVLTSSDIQVFPHLKIRLSEIKVFPHVILSISSCCIKVFTLLIPRYFLIRYQSISSSHIKVFPHLISKHFLMLYQNLIELWLEKSHI